LKIEDHRSPEIVRPNTPGDVIEVDARGGKKYLLAVRVPGREPATWNIEYINLEDGCGFDPAPYQTKRVKAKLVIDGD